MQLGELCVCFTVAESTSQSERSEANAFLGNPFSARVNFIPSSHPIHLQLMLCELFEIL